jgi:tRNA G18 (ribose-2'-O)-methylase SpoU
MIRAAPIRITDAADLRLDAYRSLRGRESSEVLWAEGPTVVERLLASSLRVRSVLLTPAAHGRLAPIVSFGDTPLFVAEQPVINEVVGFDLHRGAIAMAERPAESSLDRVLGTLSLDRSAKVLVLEGVNDAENLGAIIRSARALGADALIVDPATADPYYRRTVRVSMGEVFHLPIARAALDQVFAGLAAERFEVWAMTPRRDADPIGALTVPDRLALVLGAEGPGLTDAVLGAHRNVRIPVLAAVDSLNVGHAVAAALAVVQSSSP